MQIEIDFEVWKALTVRRAHEGVTYNDVLRELLDLEPSEAIAGPMPDAESVGGFTSRNLFLPNGTDLRGLYKRRLFSAQIRNGHWVDSDGRTHESPSAAARFITRNSVNGLRFWEAKRPGDHEFRRLDFIAANVR
jgi:hypothetical protein